MDPSRHQPTARGEGTDEYDVFLATPMSAYGDDAAYQAGRALVLSFIRGLDVECGLRRTYFAGQAITSQGQFDSEESSLATDIAALRRSRIFCLVYPAKLLSSVFVEIGYAMALDKPCVIFARHRCDLPYLLVSAAEAGSIEGIPPMRIVEYGDDADLLRRLTERKDLFSFEPGADRRGG